MILGTEKKQLHTGVTLHALLSRRDLLIKKCNAVQRSQLKFQFESVLRPWQNSLCQVPQVPHVYTSAHLAYSAQIISEGLMPLWCISDMCIQREDVSPQLSVLLSFNEDWRLILIISQAHVNMSSLALFDQSDKSRPQGFNNSLEARLLLKTVVSLHQGSHWKQFSRDPILNGEALHPSPFVFFPHIQSWLGQHKGLLGFQF